MVSIGLAGAIPRRPVSALPLRPFVRMLTATAAVGPNRRATH